MDNRISRIFSSLPKEIKYIFGLFLVSRLALIIIGVAARAYFIRGAFPWDYSRFSWLAIWGVWDSGWYLRIAQYGYSSALSNLPATFGQASYAFFPLYPLLMHLIGVIVGNYFIAGLIISNVCLLAAAWYFYKLAALEEGADVARRSVKYLFLFPVAFIFSGVFTESLFLLLAVAGFYYARRHKWVLAGCLGFFAALTRPLGVLLVVPMVIEFYLQHGFSISAWLKRSWTIFLPVLGTIVFGWYCKMLTGNFFGFLHTQTAWHRQISNPLRLVYGALIARDPYNIFAAGFALVCLLLLVIYYRQIRFSYWVFAVMVILLPMFSGLESLPRYTLSAFPLFLVFAKMTVRTKADKLLTVLLILSQGLFMALWTLGLNYIK
ncbi:MAG: hypothetical protein P4L74_00045 [Candidatus Doudnabacteria bacterium]|nr:hypothetical protein [Candidatus Doudnabacteria bacterium]